MADHDDDRVFTGSVPEVYDRYLVPLIFEPYAADLASRLARLDATEVLEVAAGTGVLTCELAARLPRGVAITASDLNQPMIDHAASVGTDRPVTWRQADVVTDAAATVFPDDPPMFLARTPYGYFDHDEIRADVAAGGFAGTTTIDALEARSLADTCGVPALAYCQGTPLRNEIVQRDPMRLAEVTATAAAAISDRFGPTDVDGRVRGFVVTAHKT